MWHHHFWSLTACHDRSSVSSQQEFLLCQLPVSQGDNLLQLETLHPGRLLRQGHLHYGGLLRLRAC